MLPLWLSLGVVLVLLGVVAPATAGAATRTGVATDSLGASATSVGDVALTAEHVLRERCIVPTQVSRELHDEGLAYAPEDESEDEDPSEISAPASAGVHAHSDVVAPPRLPIVEARRRWVTSGLGRGPPPRRR